MKSFGNDQHLDVCQNIELGLKRAYEVNPLLTDSQCVMALDNAKTAIITISLKNSWGSARHGRCFLLLQRHSVFQCLTAHPTVN
jgi:hypothetical protein